MISGTRADIVPQIDAEQIKASVDIVEIIGKFVELKQKGSGFKGCCPFHDEKTPSFNVNPELRTFKCFGCQEQGSVIDFIMKHKDLEYKAACEFLGADIDPEQKPTPRKKPAKKQPAKPVPLSYEDAKNHYTRDIMQDRADYILNKDPEDEPHEFKEAWPFKNDKGEVELVAARFETESGHKTVLSMYWNGKTIKLKDYPVLLFNRDLLAAHPEKPALIVEGEKSAKAATDSLTDFISTTWNGGGAKCKDVDWSPLKNREVFIYPDDDQKKYKENHPRAGQIVPHSEQPGNKTAAEIKKKIPHAKIVKPLPAARKIKPSGADIVEALECMAAPELTAYILDTHNPDNINDKQVIGSDVDDKQTDTPPDKSIYPFTVLGVAEDSRAYFIGQEDRLLSLSPLSITKTQLLNLVNVEWWQGAYGDEGTGAKMWEKITSDIIHAVSTEDFDADRMRGLGAWREPDGRVCYYDGSKIYGDYSKDRIFVRRPQKKIGIDSKPATKSQRRQIYTAASELTFETFTDCVRVLGWAALAPFAGALPWRPAILITASSGSGKSAIVNTLVNKLSKSKTASGESSSPAGIRQNIGVDACSVIIEEAEENRKEYFSLMRQSTTDDTPDAYKGTQDGRGTSFKLKSMFMFIAIDPTIEKEGDENRIFTVGLRKGKHNSDQWADVEADMKAAVPDSVCDGVRSFTWSNLKNIIDLAEKLTRPVQIAAKIDNRTAYADALLIAAHIYVFEDNSNPSDEYISDFMGRYYGLVPLETRLNENEEMLDIILDYIIREGTNNYTVRELLGAIETGKIYSDGEDGSNGEPRQEEIDLPSHIARRIAGQRGVGLSPCKNIAIAKNHQEVMKMLDKGRGYHQQLVRHPRLVSRGKNVSLGSNNTRGCVVIGWERDDEK